MLVAAYVIFALALAGRHFLAKQERADPSELPVQQLCKVDAVTFQCFCYAGKRLRPTARIFMQSSESI
jgi:hypothetical protein